MTGAQKPINLYPNAVTVPVDTTFAWTTQYWIDHLPLDAEANSYYNLFINGVKDGTSILATEAVPPASGDVHHHIAGTLNPGTEYSWNVVAWRNNAGWTSATSDTTTFDTSSSPYIPPSLTYIIPTLDSTVGRSNVLFQWHALGQTSITSTVYLGTVEPLPAVSIQSDGSDATMSYTTNLVQNTVYLWKVNVTDGTDSTTGPTWAFQIYPYINTFNVNPQRDNSSVVSSINTDSLVEIIQTDNPDTYFDNTNEVGKVYIYYTHQDGRQEKRIIHNQDGTNLTGLAAWTSYAKDGTWEMTRVRTFDHDGASHDMGRASFGTYQDISIP